jgi:hypothetical protein
LAEVAVRLLGVSAVCKFLIKIYQVMSHCNSLFNLPEEIASGRWRWPLQAIGGISIDTAAFGRGLCDASKRLKSL